MLVELTGKSLKGVFALARNQGCTYVGSITYRKEDKLWRLAVILPAQRW